MTTQQGETYLLICSEDLFREGTQNGSLTMVHTDIFPQNSTSFLYIPYDKQLYHYISVWVSVLSLGATFCVSLGAHPWVLLKLNSTSLDVCPRFGHPSLGVCSRPGHPSLGVCPRPGHPSLVVCPRPGHPSLDVCPRPGHPSLGVCPRPGHPSLGGLASLVCVSVTSMVASFRSVF